MLHTETIKRETLELLKVLQNEDMLSSFHLAGGTALALYLGHRQSMDLDLFTPYPFDRQILKDFLESTYGFEMDFGQKNTLKGSISNIKIDLITHAYNMIKEPNIENGIRLYSMEDIIAMKLSAITDNGTRLKDFVDIAFLSSRFSLLDMLDFYHRKFPRASLIGPLKGILYFNDIDFSAEISLMTGGYDWKTMERRLCDMVRMQDKVFDLPPVKQQNDKTAPQKRKSRNR